MKKKKILLVYGTRPEAIKMAPLVNEFKVNKTYFSIYVCVTGQHREMLDQVNTLFNIVPDFDLNIMKQGQDLYDITSRVLIGMRDVLSQITPDYVFVHGDTSTSTAVALAAFYKQIPVCHVEAGLRTWNVYSPWPEEMNRQLTGRLTTYHFAPTTFAKNNLLNEAVQENKIEVTGNTVIDALYWVVNKLKTDNAIRETAHKMLMEAGLPKKILLSEEFINSKLILITGHRRESFGDGFLNICRAIKRLANKYKAYDFVYPMHLNPNVRKPINEVFSDTTNNKDNNCYFIEPLDYLPFVYLMERSLFILTDSGGIQEEASGLRKPILVMRDSTERPEAVEAGVVKLVGANEENIVKEVSKLIEEKDVYLSMINVENPYGDGKASQRIVDFMKKQ